MPVTVEPRRKSPPLNHGSIPMSLFHAVVYIDHHAAKVTQFGAGQLAEEKVHTHLQYTRQHGSEVRSEHEFFGKVCDALEAIPEVLVTGGHTATADFRHYLEKHRPLTAARVMDYIVVDHPTDPQLVALARKHFLRLDKMVGITLPK